MHVEITVVNDDAPSRGKTTTFTGGLTLERIELVEVDWGERSDMPPWRLSLRASGSDDVGSTTYRKWTSVQLTPDDLMMVVQFASSQGLLSVGVALPKPKRRRKRR
jgi:hypothetical protein